MKKTIQFITCDSLICLVIGFLFCFEANAQESFEIVRNASGKPDFSGIHQWPLQLPHDEDGGSSATIFDRKYFAPLLPEFQVEVVNIFY